MSYAGEHPVHCALRSGAYEHARQAGHTVTVTSEQELVIEAVPGD